MWVMDQGCWRTGGCRAEMNSLSGSSKVVAPKTEPYAIRGGCCGFGMAGWKYTDPFRGWSSPRAPCSQLETRWEIEFRIKPRNLVGHAGVKLSRSVSAPGIEGS